MPPQIMIRRLSARMLPGIKPGTECRPHSRRMRLRIAIIGFGKLGQACAHAMRECAGLELAGIVRRGEHVRELRAVQAALVCVPAAATLEVAADLLQQRIAIVECAVLEGPALDAHHAELMRHAARHRTRAMVGAGWDPGVLTLLRHGFAMLMPHGAEALTRRPVLPLHHTTQAIPGVRGALVTEQRAGAERQRYLYVELAPGTTLEAVRAAVSSDPAFAGEQTQVFAVDSIAELEAEGHGLLLERRGSRAALVLEARFDPVLFAARAMLDAAQRLPGLGAGGHRYFLSL
jgi:diaminopimelate dehydrogenase